MVFYKSIVIHVGIRTAVIWTRTSFRDPNCPRRQRMGGGLALLIGRMIDGQARALRDTELPEKPIARTKFSVFVPGTPKDLQPR